MYGILNNSNGLGFQADCGGDNFKFLRGRETQSDLNFKQDHSGDCSR